MYNQRCYLVGAEVRLNHQGIERYADLDSHTVIDVCGVGLKYLPEGKKRLIKGSLTTLKPRLGTSTNSGSTF